MAVVLPFEEPLFREAGARATFVGHPLLDGGEAPLPRSEFCRRAGVDPDRPVLALFPGSRAQELDRHLELFGAAADRVRARHDGVQPVIAASSDVPGERYADSRYPCTRDSQSLLRHARAALVKSGTTTLETALAGVPMVIAYKTHPVSYWLAKRLVEVDHIGLVNLVAGRRLVPEFVQDAATPGALAGALAPFLERDGAERSAVVEGLEAVHAALGSGVEDAEGAADGVARLAQGLLRDR